MTITGKIGLDEQLCFTQQKLEQVKKQQANINLMVQMLTDRIHMLEGLKADNTDTLSANSLNNKESYIQSQQ